MTDFVTVAEAAKLSGISEGRLRRWIAAGRLPVSDRSRAGQRGRLIALERVRALGCQADRDWSATETDRHLSDTDRTPPDSDLVQLVRDLTQQNLELAGRLGFLQARNADLEELLRLQEALRESAAPSFWGWLRARVSAAASKVL
jgi:hypothetical protein